MLLSIVGQKGAEGDQECCRKQTACGHDTQDFWLLVFGSTFKEIVRASKERAE